MNIAIVDCGMGNLYSVEAALRRAGASPFITNNPAQIESADKVILPGDGHFAACMREIENRNLRATLIHAATNKPFLGICIGMQVLYERSEESSDIAGLSILSGSICKLPSSAGKIPHIGWNTTRLSSHPLWKGIENESRFYFIHSFYAPPDSSTIAHTHYGTEFAAAAAKDSLYAVQFHPEKSASVGAKVIENFCGL